MQYFKALKVAKFAADSLTAAGLDLEAAMATENVEFLAEALQANASAAARIAELEAAAVEVETLQASYDTVKEQAEHLHDALTASGIDPDAENLGELIAAKASTQAAEIAASAGITPLEANVEPAATDKSNTPADKYAHYKTLTGEARLAYFSAHKDAIWQARGAESAGRN